MDERKIGDRKIGAAGSPGRQKYRGKADSGKEGGRQEAIIPKNKTTNYELHESQGLLFVSFVVPSAPF
jgi:hypothetical protein